jgi:hypothetical protein
MPHVDAEPTTHYPGCWRDPEHHVCAVRLIEHTITIMNKLIDYAPMGQYIAWLDQAGAFALVEDTEQPPTPDTAA